MAATTMDVHPALLMVLIAHGCGDHVTPGVVANGPNDGRWSRPPGLVL